MQDDKAQKLNRRVALIATGSAAAMLGLTYASVPLYSAFCRATGYGGTPQRAEKAPATSTDQVITIRFDANTAGGLGWNFQPAQKTLDVKLGEQSMAFYRVTNTSGRKVTGSAIFNVTPEASALYFNKIQCFCFSEQTLGPGETADLPVVFFVDPAITADADTKAIREITLSYTFYPVEHPKAVSQATAAPGTTTN